MWFSKIGIGFYVVRFVAERREIKLRERKLQLIERESCLSFGFFRDKDLFLSRSSCEKLLKIK